MESNQSSDRDTISISWERLNRIFGQTPPAKDLTALLELTPLSDFSNLWGRRWIMFGLSARARHLWPNLGALARVLIAGTLIIFFFIVTLGTVGLAVAKGISKLFRSSPTVDLENSDAILITYLDPDLDGPGDHLRRLPELLTELGLSEVLIGHHSFNSKQTRTKMAVLSDFWKITDLVQEISSILWLFLSRGIWLAGRITLTLQGAQSLAPIAYTLASNLFGPNAIDSRLTRRAFVRILGRATNASLVIYPMENQAWERALNSVASSNLQLRRIGFVHTMPGVMDNRFNYAFHSKAPSWRNLSPQNVACTSEFNKHILLKVHRWPRPVTVVESLRLGVQAGRSGRKNIHGASLYLGLAKSYSAEKSTAMLRSVRRTLRFSKDESWIIRDHPYRRATSEEKKLSRGFHLSKRNEDLTQFLNRLKVIVADENSLVFWQALSLGLDVLMLKPLPKPVGDLLFKSRAEVYHGNDQDPFILIRPTWQSSAILRNCEAKLGRLERWSALIWRHVDPTFKNN